MCGALFYLRATGQTESLDEDLNAIVAGAGLEYKLIDHLNGRIEVERYWIGPDGPTWQATTIVRAGLTFRFTN